MSEAPTSAGEAVLAAVQDAALGLARPFDSEQATRFEAALEALAPNTRRAYGSALATWGRWAALVGVPALTPSPFALRAYLQERASDGAGISSLRLTVAALRKGAGARRRRADRERPGGDRYGKRAGAPGFGRRGRRTR